MGSRVDLCTCSPPGTPAAPRHRAVCRPTATSSLRPSGARGRNVGGAAGSSRRAQAGGEALNCRGPWVVPRAMRMANSRFRTTERVMRSVAAFAHATTGTSRRPPTPRGRSPVRFLPAGRVPPRRHRVHPARRRRGRRAGASTFRAARGQSPGHGRAPFHPSAIKGAPDVTEASEPTQTELMVYRPVSQMLKLFVLPEDLPLRGRAPGRWRQGEGAGRAPTRHRGSGPPEAEREGRRQERRRGDRLRYVSTLDDALELVLSRPRTEGVSGAPLSEVDGAGDCRAAENRCAANSASGLGDTLQVRRSTRASCGSRAGEVS